MSNTKLNKIQINESKLNIIKINAGTSTEKIIFNTENNHQTKDLNIIKSTTATEFEIKKAQNNNNTNNNHHSNNILALKIYKIFKRQRNRGLAPRLLTHFAK